MTIDSLWQSFANSDAASLEAQAIEAAIEQAVAEGGLGGIRAREKEWSYDYHYDEEERICGYGIQSAELRETGVTGRARRTLSIAISFYRPEDRAGDDWPGGQRAKVYVGVAPTSKAWDSDSLLVDGCGRSDVAVPISPYRWARPGTPQAWFFCVALDAIEGRAALTSEVLEPLRILLGGGKEQTAFAGCRALLAPPAAG